MDELEETVSKLYPKSSETVNQCEKCSSLTQYLIEQHSRNHQSIANIHVNVYGRSQK